jgi:hypothetical protein
VLFDVLDEGAEQRTTDAAVTDVVRQVSQRNTMAIVVVHRSEPITDALSHDHRYNVGVTQRADSLPSRD